MNATQIIIERPTKEQIRAARGHAGHTQGQAAALVGAGSHRTWNDWERGIAAMPGAAWTVYLLATEQHPEFKLHRGFQDH